MRQVSGKPFTTPGTKTNTGNAAVTGHLYGSGDIAIIFSNMDTNDQNEWIPIIPDLISTEYLGLTYAYTEQRDDQSGTLEEVISFVCDMGIPKIVLIGASRGGVASIKLAARHTDNDSIAGVVAISPRIEYEGTVFYSNEELEAIRVPKLLINTDRDEGADDNRKMINIFREPKELLFYSGDAHGTELFDKERESIIQKLDSFIKSVTTKQNKAENGTG